MVDGLDERLDLEYLPRLRDVDEPKELHEVDDGVAGLAADELHGLLVAPRGAALLDLHALRVAVERLQRVSEPQALVEPRARGAEIVAVAHRV